MMPTYQVVLRHSRELRLIQRIKAIHKMCSSLREFFGHKLLMTEKLQSPDLLVRSSR